MKAIILTIGVLLGSQSYSHASVLSRVATAFDTVFASKSVNDMRVLIDAVMMNHDEFLELLDSPVFLQKVATWSASSDDSAFLVNVLVHLNNNTFLDEAPKKIIAVKVLQTFDSQYSRGLSEKMINSAAFAIKSNIEADYLATKIALFAKENDPLWLRNLAVFQKEGYDKVLAKILNIYKAL